MGKESVAAFIAVGSTRAGVGKGSLLAGLAISLSVQGIRVAVLDTDHLQPLHVRQMLQGRQPLAVYGDLAELIAPTGDRFRRAFCLTHTDQLSYFPCTRDRRLRYLLHDATIRDLLVQLHRGFEVVLVNLPSGPSGFPLELPSMRRDPRSGPEEPWQLVVSTPDIAALVGLDQILQQRSLAAAARRDRLALVLNRVPRGVEDRDLADRILSGPEVTGVFRLPLLSKIPMIDRFRIAGGDPVSLSDRSTPLGTAFSGLSRNVLSWIRGAGPAAVDRDPDGFTPISDRRRNREWDDLTRSLIRDLAQQLMLPESQPVPFLEGSGDRIRVRIRLSGIVRPSFPVICRLSPPRMISVARLSPASFLLGAAAAVVSCPGHPCERRDAPVLANRPIYSFPDNFFARTDFGLPPLDGFRLAGPGVRPSPPVFRPVDPAGLPIPTLPELLGYGDLASEARQRLAEIPIRESALEFQFYFAPFTAEFPWSTRWEPIGRSAFNVPAMPVAIRSTTARFEPATGHTREARLPSIPPPSESPPPVPDLFARTWSLAGVRLRLAPQATSPVATPVVLFAAPRCLASPPIRFPAPEWSRAFTIPNAIRIRTPRSRWSPRLHPVRLPVAGPPLRRPPAMTPREVARFAIDEAPDRSPRVPPVSSHRCTIPADSRIPFPFARPLPLNAAGGPARSDPRATPRPSPLAAPEAHSRDPVATTAMTGWPPDRRPLPAHFRGVRPDAAAIRRLLARIEATLTPHLTITWRPPSMAPIDHPLPPRLFQPMVRFDHRFTMVCSGPPWHPTGSFRAGAGDGASSSLQLRALPPLTLALPERAPQPMPETVPMSARAKGSLVLREALAAFRNLGFRRLRVPVQLGQQVFTIGPGHDHRANAVTRSHGPRTATMLGVATDPRRLALALHSQRLQSPHIRGDAAITTAARNAGFAQRNGAVAHDGRQCPVAATMAARNVSFAQCNGADRHAEAPGGGFWRMARKPGPTVRVPPEWFRTPVTLSPLPAATLLLAGQMAAACGRRALATTFATRSLLRLSASHTLPASPVAVTHGRRWNDIGRQAFGYTPVEAWYHAAPTPWVFLVTDRDWTIGMAPMPVITWLPTASPLTRADPTFSWALPASIARAPAFPFHWLITQVRPPEFAWSPMPLSEKRAIASPPAADLATRLANLSSVRFSIQPSVGPELFRGPFLSRLVRPRSIERRRTALAVAAPDPIQVMFSHLRHLGRHRLSRPLPDTHRPGRRRAAPPDPARFAITMPQPSRAVCRPPVIGRPRVRPPDKHVLPLRDLMMRDVMRMAQQGQEALARLSGSVR